MLARSSRQQQPHAEGPGSVERYGIPPRRSMLCTSASRRRTEPTPLDDVPVASGRPTVSSWAASPAKGPEYFMDVARRVADHVPAAEFILAGTGGFGSQHDRARGRAGPGRSDALRGRREGRRSGPALSRGRRLRHAFRQRAARPGRLKSLRNGTPCIIPKTAGVAEVLPTRDAGGLLGRGRHGGQGDRAAGSPTALGGAERRRPGDEVRDARLGLDEAARRTGEAYAVALGGGLSAIRQSP